MDERLARIALACTTEPGSAEIAEAVSEHGPEQVLSWATQGGVPASTCVGRLTPDEVPGMLRDLQLRGVRVLVSGDPEFPTQLADLAEPPLALWVRGPLDLRMTALRSVAVVGARACTPYGERATQLLAGGLAETGWAVVSGGAFGIDAAAHRAALAVEGPTLAVLACGIDVAYPRAHDALLNRIGDVGAVVSELPPGSAPLKHRFLARNRIIAALSRGTVVVEAARRSGAIATANRALELGREVMAVPGPITSIASAGTNRLLHERTARAVTTPDEIVSLLVTAPAVEPTLPGTSLPPAGTRSSADLPEAARALWSALPARGGVDVAAAAERAGLGPADCLAQLGVLEILGMARRTTRGWRRCD